MERHQFDRVAAELAAGQHGAFALSQLDRAGCTPTRVRRRVDAGRWEPLARGVYKMAGTPPSWEQWLWAAHLEAGPESVISHATAAQLLGFRELRAEEVHLLRLRPGNHRVTLSRLHRTTWLPASHVTVVDGLPCTTVARCVFDLAGDPPSWARGRPRALEVHALRISRILNNALARHGLTVEKMAEVVAGLGRRGRPGTALMRRLMREVGADYVPTESEIEAMLLSLVRSAGLAEPRRQVVVGGDDGRIGRVDFLFREAKVMVEVDGGPWHDGPLDRDLDTSRDLKLRAAGWEVIRVRWHQLVNEPELIIAAIHKALAEGQKRAS